MIQPIKNLLGHKYTFIAASVFQLCATYAMFMPTSGLPDLAIPFFDKLAHIGIYLLSFLLWAFSFVQQTTNYHRLVLKVALLLLFYGMVIEVIQGKWIPDRTFDSWDLLANFAGLLSGILVFYILKPFWQAKN